MKKLYALLIFVSMSNVLLAQSDRFKIAMEHFKLNYNAEKYDEIFNSFSAKMQTALPLNKTTQFLKGLKQEAGNVTEFQFLSSEHPSTEVFKTQFERTIFAVSLSLDDENKLNGLLIKPYQDSAQVTKKAANALTYPAEIAELIFAKSNEFPNNTQLSIAIVQNGNVDFYGITRINDTIKPIENQRKVFEIGSITKVFTATVLATLVENGKIKLTDHINTNYPFAFKNNIKIQFDHLANHTSGLPRMPQNFDISNTSNPYKKYGKKQIDRYLKDLIQLETEPVKVYDYSNLGAGLLGYTLGLTQQKKFQEVLQEMVLDKYKMTNSFTSSEKLGDKLVKGLSPEGKPVSNWDFDMLFGAGGMLSTSEDLAKFALAHFEPQNQELALTRTPTFTINDEMRIGLGWHILKSKNGSDLFWHNGGTAGYSSSMVVNIDKKTAVIILSNVSAFGSKTSNIDELCLELINRF